MSWLNVVIIPCHNEEATIQRVIGDVRQASPDSEIVVVDNASMDRTAELAKALKVSVISCEEKGKGRAIRAALRRLDADSYTIVDGDSTYDLSRLPEMIRAVQQGTFMSVGVRRAVEANAFPTFHRFGNRLFTLLLSGLFGRPMKDVLSGLRVFHSEFVQFSPLSVDGFEVEAFYSLEAAVRRVEVREFDISYYQRPEGSSSKLRSFRDGFKILACIFNLFRVYRPLPFFSFFSVLCFLFGLASGYQPVLEYFQEGYVYAVPRAVLAASFVNLSFLLLGVGMMLASQMQYHLKQIEIMQSQKKSASKSIFSKVA